MPEFCMSDWGITVRAVISSLVEKERWLSVTIRN